MSSEEEMHSLAMHRDSRQGRADWGLPNCRWSEGSTDLPNLESFFVTDWWGRCVAVSLCLFPIVGSSWADASRIRTKINEYSRLSWQICNAHLVGYPQVSNWKTRVSQLVTELHRMLKNYRKVTSFFGFFDQLKSLSGSFQLGGLYPFRKSHSWMKSIWLIEEPARESELLLQFWSVIHKLKEQLAKVLNCTRISYT